MSKKKSNEPANDSRKERAARAMAAASALKDKDQKERRSKMLFVSFITLVVVAILSAAIITAMNSKPTITGELVNPTKATADYGFKVTAADFDKPAAVEPVELVLYEDFLCPHCKSFEEMFGDYLQEKVEEGALDIEYRVVAFMDQSSQSKRYSHRALAASVCMIEEAGVQKWIDFKEKLWETQPASLNNMPTDMDLLELGRKVHPELTKDCVANQVYVPWADKVTAEFNDSDIGGTPAAFIDGEKVETGVLQEKLTELFAARDAALAEK